MKKGIFTFLLGFLTGCTTILYLVEKEQQLENERKKLEEQIRKEEAEFGEDFVDKDLDDEWNS